MNVDNAMTDAPRKLLSFAIQQPDWAYLNLELLGLHNVDMITWKLTVDKAVRQHLGLTGLAIPVDILHTENSEEQSQVWLRVPGDNLTHIWAALSGFETTIDSGGLAVRSTIKVIRTSRFLIGVTGPERDLWRVFGVNK